MYNYCKFAHSNEELDEWKERWEWRQMKREIAKKEQVYSYMETLLEDYEEEYSGINVVRISLRTDLSFRAASLQKRVTQSCESFVLDSQLFRLVSVTDC